MTCPGLPVAFHDTFLLTCLLRGMTDTYLIRVLMISVSTHMPLARHDGNRLLLVQNSAGFYSHASCEAWPFWDIFLFTSAGFLLTCLLRGMTGICYIQLYGMWFLLTCLLRGMTGKQGILLFIDRFLLTCLLRGMTWWVRGFCKKFRFYSHASCEAWQCFSPSLTSFCSFYSHASCEAWQMKTRF